MKVCKQFTEVQRRQILVSQPLAPLSGKNADFETRFKKYFLKGMKFQTQEVHNKDIWTHFVVHHLISEKQILVF